MSEVFQPYHGKQQLSKSEKILPAFSVFEINIFYFVSRLEWNEKKEAVSG